MECQLLDGRQTSVEHTTDVSQIVIVQVEDFNTRCIALLVNRKSITLDYTTNATLPVEHQGVFYKSYTLQ